MQALILAAGYATRLYPLTKDRPKALLPIGGRPMLDYLMRAIAETGRVSRAVIVTNSRFFGQFVDWAAGASYPGMTIEVLDDGTNEDTGKRGAVGDIAFGVETAGIDDDLLVAASDNLFTFSLVPFFEEFERAGRDTLLGQRMTDPALLRRFAVAKLDERGRVTSLIEKPERPDGELGIYALYLYRRDTLPLLEKYLAEGNPPDAPGHFPEWLYTRREVGVYAFEGECVDIGTPEAYAAACETFAARNDKI